MEQIDIEQTVKKVFEDTDKLICEKLTINNREPLTATENRTNERKDK